MTLRRAGWGLFVAAAFSSGCIVREKEKLVERWHDAQCDPLDAPPESATEDSASPDTSVADTYVLPDTSEPETIDAADACAPTPGAYHVSPTGDDVSGNGSVGCPFKTIQRGIDAASTATAASQVLVHAGTYGEGCTNPTKCDTLPISVPATFIRDLVIKGDGPTAVRVTGSTTSVFLIQGARVGLEGMNVVPKRLAAANGGTHGIVYDVASPASGDYAKIQNLTVSGVAGSATNATGTDVHLKGAARVRLWDAVLLGEGFYGALVEDTATLLMNGTTDGGVKISGAAAACVKAFSASTTTSPTLITDTVAPGSGTVLANCGPEGGVRIDTAKAGASSFYGLRVEGVTLGAGIHLLNAASLQASNVTVRNVNGHGALIEGTARLNADGLFVSGNGGDGVRVTSGTLAGVTIKSTSNKGDGIRCEGGSLEPRAIEVLSNVGSGVVVRGSCAATLTDYPVFNKTSQKNGVSGLCFDRAGSLSLVGATFGCGWTGSTCSSTSTPTKSTAGPGCQVGFDISTPAGGTVTTTGPSCCN